jgi:hypothetical protein
MNKFKFFYTDYCEGKTIPAENADQWYVTKEEILHSMDCVLHMPDNFLGIVDKYENTLQFAVNKDRSIHIEIPSPKELGSYGKEISLEEALNTVRNLGEIITCETIGGLKFQKWNSN